jgi:hypothetical protein
LINRYLNLRKGYAKVYYLNYRCILKENITYSIVLAVNVGNIVAQKFYKKVEFVHKGIRIQIENSPSMVMRFSL